MENQEQHLFIGKAIRKQREKREAKREEREEAGKPVGLGQRVKAAVSTVANSAGFAPLLPLRAAMKHILRKRGMPNPPDKIEALAQAFHQVVIMKRDVSRFDFDEMSEAYFVDPATIGMIVAGIVSFFKNLAQKKKEARATADEEEAIALAEAGTDGAVSQGVTAADVARQGARILGGSLNVQAQSGNTGIGVGVRVGPALPGGQKLIPILIAAAAAYFLIFAKD